MSNNEKVLKTGAVSVWHQFNVKVISFRIIELKKKKNKMSTLFTFFASIATLFVVIYIYIQKTYDYWKRRGISYIVPSFPFGTFPKYFSKELSLADELQEHYRYSSQRFVGLYSWLRPALLIRDTNIIKDILGKDSSYFINCDNQNVDRMHVSLLTEDKSDSVSFELKRMCDAIIDCGDSIESHLDDYVKSGESIEMHGFFEWLTRSINAKCFNNPTGDKRDCDNQDLASKTTESIDSSSALMSFCMYELARNSKVQQKAYEDIVSVLKIHNQKLTFDTLKDMKYVENCILGKVSPKFYKNFHFKGFAFFSF